MTRSEQPDANRAGLNEDLVAYLDGELDAETSREVEDLLSTDSLVREKMQNLEQAWDLLDELPQSEVDEAFTHSTIEMVAISAAEEIELMQGHAPRQRRRRLLVGLGSVLAALALGFFTVTAFWPDPNRQLLEDLPLLERLDQYRQVENIDYLRSLQAQGLWTEQSAVREEPTTLADRQLLVEQMSAEEKESIRRKQQRFAAMSPAEQAQLRNLHQAIEQDGQSAELRQTLGSYYAWLIGIPQAQRAGLTSLESDARLERIAVLRTEEQQQEQQQRAYRADLEQVAAWMEGLIRERIAEDQPLTAKLESLSEVEQRGLLMWLAYQRGARFVNQVVPDRTEALRDKLSPAGQERFDQEDAEGRRRLLVSFPNGLVWQAMRDSIRAYIGSVMAGVEQEELVQFFHELEQDDKDDLLRSPSSDYRDFRLRMMYLREHKRDRLPEFAQDLRPESLWWLSGFGDRERSWASRDRGRSGTLGGMPGSRSPGQRPSGGAPFGRGQGQR